MTAHDRVVRAARTLRAALWAATVLRAAGIALAVLLAAAGLDALVGLPLAARRLVPIVLAAAGSFTVMSRWRRRGRDTSIVSVALWIEERFPALHYALVTAVDPSAAGTAELEQQATRVRFEDAVMRGARGALVRPAAWVAAGVLAVALLPHGAVTRVARAREGDALERTALRRSANPLATIVVRVTPPAYTGHRAASLDDPASLRALTGSAVVVEGLAAGAAVTATVGARHLQSTVQGERWRLELPMPSSPAAVRLRSGAHERLLVLEPVPDSAPVVTLSRPSRDTIYRRPTGVVRLAADASDDIGLAAGGFELIVSSGNGENFTFRQAMIGAAVFNGRSGALAATLSLDSLRLQPGDVIHLRALARDHNDVSGPGIGSSETRTLRIARVDEYDSVAVDPAPPTEPEKNALSQRLILLLTEALEKRRPKLPRAEFVGESRRIAADQARLRKRVGELVFHRLGEDSGEESGGGPADKPVNPDSVLAAAERATGAGAGAALEGEGEDSPLLAINRPLLEAYNHMWQASTELEVGEPGRAIPWMRKALDAIEASRSAERIYLRGRTRAVVVDIERVRLQGKDKGTPAARTPRENADPSRALRLARFDVALELLRAAPAAAIDSLLLLRVELLDRDAVTARALDDATNALRAGRDATAALRSARRALAGVTVRRDTIGAWGGVW